MPGVKQRGHTYLKLFEYVWPLGYHQALKG